MKLSKDQEIVDLIIYNETSKTEDLRVKDALGKNNNNMAESPIWLESEIKAIAEMAQKLIK